MDGEVIAKFKEKIKRYPNHVTTPRLYLQLVY